MTIVTTHVGEVPKPKPFTWSYSRLKNYETCPWRHWNIDLAPKDKRVTEPKSESLLWGDECHNHLAKRVSKKIPLPGGMEGFEHWCAKIDPKPDYPTELFTEQKLAFTKNFQPCGYFDDGVWFRCVSDVTKIMGPVALTADWKTGKILEDSVQLGLTAQAIFAHFPQVQRVRTEFIWLKYDASSREDFTRADMADLWRGLYPRIAAMEQAWNSQNYPAKPGGLCRIWCPVTACQHHGVG